VRVASTLQTSTRSLWKSCASIWNDDPKSSLSPLSPSAETPPRKDSVAANFVLRRPGFLPALSPPMSLLYFFSSHFTLFFSPLVGYFFSGQLLLSPPSPPPLSGYSMTLFSLLSLWLSGSCEKHLARIIGSDRILASPLSLACLYPPHRSVPPLVRAVNHAPLLFPLPPPFSLCSPLYYQYLGQTKKEQRALIFSFNFWPLFLFPSSPCSASSITENG
jgi:hypothetical protein